MTEELTTHRVLVVRDAMRDRAEAGDAQFRLVVLNPARAEVHPLHPERRDKAAEAEITLRSALSRLELSVHAPVIGSVSVRHDPMDAVEEVLFSEPVDEILLDVPPHRLSSWLHQDLGHRLAHFKVPVTTIRHGQDEG
jgi:hypothetical protein